MKTGKYLLRTVDGEFPVLFEHKSFNIGCSLLIGVNFFSKIQGVCQRVSHTLPPSSLICMKHRTLTTRWPPSRHLPSGHLPQGFKRAYPECAPQYCNYQLPDYLYISLKITSIKASHASEQVQPTSSCHFT